MKPNTVLFLLGIMSVVFCMVFVFFSLPPSIPQNQIKSSMYLESKKTKYTLNEPITVTVYANSDTEPITGFDVVLLYDPTKLSYSEYSLLTNAAYDSALTKQPGKIMLTGYEKGSNLIKQSFSQTPLATFTFKPQAEGNAYLKLEYISASKTDSNLINSETVDILKTVGNLEISISK